MNIATGKLVAQPYFVDMCCPKHGNKMIELNNGWFDICWYCEECKYPYELQLRKMPKVNSENLKNLLDNYYSKHNNK